MMKPTGRIRSWLRSILIATLVALLFWTVMIMMFEERFIFFPAVYPEGPYAAEQRVLKPEEHTFKTPDGVTLHAWFLRAEPAVGTILFFHGNAGNLSQRGEILRRLWSAGFNVFIFDYRGYGKSEGSPTEAGVYLDGLAAAGYLSTLSGIDSSKILYYGSSLGGAVAIDVATHRQPAGLILVSTFSSARDVARAVYPFLPISLLLHSRFDSESKIRTMRCPVLAFHGSDDTVIPINLGKKLFEAAPQPKEFHEVQGAGHNDLFLVSGQDFLNRIRAFAETLLLPSTR